MTFGKISKFSKHPKSHILRLRLIYLYSIRSTIQTLFTLLYCLT